MGFADPKIAAEMEQAIGMLLLLVLGAVLLALIALARAAAPALRRMISGSPSAGGTHAAGDAPERFLKWSGIGVALMIIIGVVAIFVSGAWFFVGLAAYGVAVIAYSALTGGGAQVTTFHGFAASATMWLLGVVILAALMVMVLKWLAASPLFRDRRARLLSAAIAMAMVVGLAVAFALRLVVAPVAEHADASAAEIKREAEEYESFKRETADRNTAHNLSAYQSTVFRYFERYKRLPPTLAEAIIKDVLFPKSGRQPAPEDYSVLGARKFRLCATFHDDIRGNKQAAGFIDHAFVHAAGRDCFAIELPDRLWARADEERSSNLFSLKMNVNYHFGTHSNTLPAGLSEVGPINPKMPLQKTDPQTDVPYEYAVSADQTYTLCAVFAARNKATNPDDPFFQNHGIGRTCYIIDPRSARPYIRSSTAPR